MASDARQILKYVPAVFLVPMFWSPIPSSHHTAREIAGYFQSRAFLTDPLQSFYYLTPLESFSALHLHSLVSAPLLAAGSYQAGRIVSFIAALCAVALVGAFSRDLFDSRVAVLTPLFLWMHPLFQRFATHWWPESLSIFLTCAVLFLTYRYTRTSNRTFYYTAAAVLAVSVTNHQWEASIALPMCALLWYHGYKKEVIQTGLVTGASVGMVTAIKSLQPTSGSLFATYGILDYWPMLFDPAWYFRLRKLSEDPFSIAMSVTLPLALCVLAWSMYEYLVAQSERSLIIGSWIFSGIIIIALLPRGFKYHYYYAWTLLVPLAFAATLAVRRGLDTLNSRDYAINSNHLVIVLVLSASLYGFGFESGLGLTTAPSEPYSVETQSQVQNAGNELEQMNIKYGSQIAFAGGWKDKDAIKYHEVVTLSRVLIYGDVTVRERDLIQGDGVGPRIVEDHQHATDCQAVIFNSDGHISVSQCE
ncbi:ArnT family glycosyltransferase [Haloarcula japonica]|uniref:ArnT family glycosyltransferase n=1 Tax=Haloarcula japonica TaxID=29282 RepID=UPI0039F733BC